MAAKKSGTSAKSKGASQAKTKHFWIGVGWIVLGVILLFYLLYGLALYLSGWTGGVTKFVTTVFPYPAATVQVPGYFGYFLLSILIVILLVLSLFKLVYLAVSGRWRTHYAKLGVVGFIFVASVAGLLTSVPPIGNAVLSYHAYLDRFNALTVFQNKRKQLSQGAEQDTPVEALQANAMNQLVVSAVIQQEARKLGVKVTAKEVNDAYKQIADRSQGEENLKKQIKEFLGWTPAQFKEEIRTRLLQEKLNTKLSSDAKLNADRKKRAEEFLAQVKAGADFAELAKQSDDPTAQAGGDLGFVKRGENDPAVEEAAFKLEVGQVSDIITTQRGYVIIKVEEKKPDEVKLRQILVRTKSLTEFIPEEFKKTAVSLFVKGLVWDKASYTVQPKNQPKPQTTPTVQVTPAAPAAPQQ